MTLLFPNCVINLSPAKERVFSEALRVLKLGGRLIVSDIVLLKELPAFIKDSITAYVGCVAGAMLKDDYLMVMEDVGFGEIEVLKETFFSVEGLANDPMAKAAINKMAISEEDLRDVEILYSAC